MAKHEGACPIATKIFIEKQAEKHGVSINRMIEEYSKDAEIPVGTLKNWVYPEKVEKAKERLRQKKVGANLPQPVPTEPAAASVAETADQTEPAPEAPVRASVQGSCSGPYMPMDDHETIMRFGGFANYFVDLAISQMQRIEDDDPDGVSALVRTEQWISAKKAKMAPEPTAPTGPSATEPTAPTKPTEGDPDQAQYPVEEQLLPEGIAYKIVVPKSLVMTGS